MELESTSMHIPVMPGQAGLISGGILDSSRIYEAIVEHIFIIFRNIIAVFTNVCNKNFVCLGSWLLL